MAYAPPGAMGISKYRPYQSTVSLAQWLRSPPRERMIPGSNPACALGIFPGSSHTNDLKIGTPVLPCQAPGQYWGWSAQCQYTGTG